MRFDCLCFDMRQEDAALFMSVCFKAWTNFPHCLKRQSSIIWFQIYLKQSQIWTRHSGKMMWAEHFPLCVFNQVQTSSNLKTFGRGQKLHIDKFTAGGGSSIPDQNVHCPCVGVSLPNLAVPLRPFWLDRHVARAAEPRGATGSRHSGHVAYITVWWFGRQVIGSPWIPARSLQRQ